MLYRRCFKTAALFALTCAGTVGEGRAQTGAGLPQWTWMRGASTARPASVYGTQGVAGAANTPGGRNSATSWTGLDGSFWLFGGYGGSRYLDELWKYEPRTGQWTWFSGGQTFNQRGIYGTRGVGDPANGPGARHSAAGWTDQAGNLWLFGGFGVDSSTAGTLGFLNDLWKYDVGTGRWTWESGTPRKDPAGVYGVPGVPAADGPGGRSGAATWTDGAGTLWLLGGFSYNGPSGYLNDLWKYNVASNQWTWVNGDSTADGRGAHGVLGVAGTAVPCARYGGISWTDNAGDLWLFGGGREDSGRSHNLNDLWRYHPASNGWTWVAGDSTADRAGHYGVPGMTAPANKPSARYGAASWTDAAGRLWLFGGTNIPVNGADDRYRNDLWVYDVARSQWAWMQGDSTPGKAGTYGTLGTPAATNGPGARSFGVNWVDTAGNLWLFGGYGYAATGPAAELNDLWRVTPVAPVPTSIASTPGPLAAVLYPNPAPGAFTVHVKGLPAPAVVSVLDIAGRVMEDAALPAGTGDVALGAALVPGFYTVAVRSGTAYHCLRVVKL